MGYGCMERLSGNWILTREPFPDGRLTGIQLSSDEKGKVTGRGNIIINGESIDFDVAGHYNGASVDIWFTMREIESRDTSEYNFTFAGNCEGDNTFDGALSGVAARLKYKG
ncbi:MAG TPA: hypothetical protein VFC63_12190 [Blastocatellia bacterium]|nr:hypothetical protein [Blastocatellia bacterium]